MIAEVLNSYSLTLDYLQRLIHDVPDEALASQANGVVNHPLWTIGHLVFAAQMIGQEIGASAWLPDDWQEQYGTGSLPVPERSAYSTRDSLLSHLRDAQRRLAERLESIGDGAMHQPLPDKRYREMFPTIGHAVAHVLIAHTAAHVGQIIVWRKVNGIAPLAKVFD